MRSLEKIRMEEEIRGRDNLLSEEYFSYPKSQL